MTSFKTTKVADDLVRSFGSALSGSLPVESIRFYQVSLGGTFTSTDNLGFFTNAWRMTIYRITGNVINFKKTEDD